MTLSLSARTSQLGATTSWLALVLFAALAFLPALSMLPVIDRDEARFVQASHQMVETGDFVDIRFQDEPRYKKPVGIYWLQSAAVAAVGEDGALWVYRLPSLIGAMLAVMLAGVTGAPLFGRPAALFAAAVFAGCLVIGGEARIAKTDAVNLATILAAQAVLARLYLGQAVGRGSILAFWLASALGLLVKGPIGPMVPALTALALCAVDRRAQWLRPLWTPLPILAALIVVLPWFVAITLRSDGAFWFGSVGADLLPKIAAGQEGKGAPPGSYFVAMWFTCWPATPLLLLALPAIWRARHQASTRFCLAWALPVWLVYEAVPTKLLHYTLPAYPALALLAVGHLAQGINLAGRGLRIAALLAAVAGLAPALILTAYSVDQKGWDALALIGIAIAAALLAGGFAVRSLRRSEFLRLAGFAALAGAVLNAGFFSALSRIPALWPTEAAVAFARQITAQSCDQPQLTGWGYDEPSLVWHGGRDTRLFSASADEAEVLKPAACSIVIHQREAGIVLPSVGNACRVAGTVSGFAIGAGHQVTLDILDCQAAP
ncbi:MAG: glycosyltransferase family 39 protein [Tabrizicola sp.]|nr:glycosyltransferase family 39 protein [Tabrizicola sp.]